MDQPQTQSTLSSQIRPLNTQSQHIEEESKKITKTNIFQSTAQSTHQNENSDTLKNPKNNIEINNNPENDQPENVAAINRRMKWDDILEKSKILQSSHENIPSYISNLYVKILNKIFFDIRVFLFNDKITDPKSPLYPISNYMKSFNTNNIIVRDMKSHIALIIKHVVLNLSLEILHETFPNVKIVNTQTQNILLQSDKDISLSQIIDILQTDTNIKSLDPNLIDIELDLACQFDITEYTIRTIQSIKQYFNKNDYSHIDNNGIVDHSIYKYYILSVHIKSWEILLSRYSETNILLQNLIKKIIYPIIQPIPSLDNKESLLEQIFLQTDPCVSSSFLEIISHITEVVTQHLRELNTFKKDQNPIHNNIFFNELNIKENIITIPYKLIKTAQNSKAHFDCSEQINSYLRDCKTTDRISYINNSNKSINLLSCLNESKKLFTAPENNIILDDEVANIIFFDVVTPVLIINTFNKLVLPLLMKYAPTMALALTSYDDERFKPQYRYIYKFITLLTIDMLCNKKIKFIANIELHMKIKSYILLELCNNKLKMDTIFINQMISSNCKDDITLTIPRFISLLVNDQLEQNDDIFRDSIRHRMTSNEAVQLFYSNLETTSSLSIDKIHPSKLMSDLEKDNNLKSLIFNTINDEVSISQSLSFIANQIDLYREYKNTTSSSPTILNENNPTQIDSSEFIGKYIAELPTIVNTRNQSYTKSFTLMKDNIVKLMKVSVGQEECKPRLYAETEFKKYNTSKQKGKYHKKSKSAKKIIEDPLMIQAKKMIEYHFTATGKELTSSFDAICAHAQNILSILIEGNHTHRVADHNVFIEKLTNYHSEIQNKIKSNKSEAIDHFQYLCSIKIEKASSKEMCSIFQSLPQSELKDLDNILQLVSEATQNNPTNNSICIQMQKGNDTYIRQVKIRQDPNQTSQNDNEVSETVEKTNSSPTFVDCSEQLDVLEKMFAQFGTFPN